MLDGEYTKDTRSTSPVSRVTNLQRPSQMRPPCCCSQYPHPIKTSLIEITQVVSHNAGRPPHHHAVAWPRSSPLSASTKSNPGSSASAFSSAFALHQHHLCNFRTHLVTPSPHHLQILEAPPLLPPYLQWTPPPPINATCKAHPQFLPHPFLSSLGLTISLSLSPQVHVNTLNILFLPSSLSLYPILSL